MAFVRGESDQYPPIRKGRHSPLQAFRSPGRGFANTRMHFTQFLLSPFWSGLDVLGNVFGIVKNLPYDAVLNPWLAEVTADTIPEADDWLLSFWERQPFPQGIREGSTNVDLDMNSTPGVVFAEVKMDAGPSTGTRHTEKRSQLVRNLGQRIAEEAAKKQRAEQKPPGKERGKTPPPPPPRQVRPVRATDVASITRVSNTQEWEQLSKKLDQHVRKLLEEGYDVELG